MTDAEWTGGHAGALTVFLNGGGIPEPDRHGRRIHDDSFLLLVNPAAGEQAFTLPGSAYGLTCAVWLDTTQPSGPQDERDSGTVTRLEAGDTVTLSTACACSAERASGASRGAS